MILTWLSPLAVHASSAPRNIIVTLTVPVTPDNVSKLVRTLNAELTNKISIQRAMSGQSLVIKPVSKNVSTNDVIHELEKLSLVLDASLDARLELSAIDDPRFNEQWQLHSNDQFLASLNTEQAWDITHGADDVVVAIVDTGIDYSHPDLTGRILPGYDFVSSLTRAVDFGVDVPAELEFLRSHDGDGADTDASDPGDAISTAVLEQFETLGIECTVGNSSWHGTAMASIIAANVNDGIGIAGIDWHAKILPVRAIGKCGGHRSDMLDAIRWAAGVEDPYLPPNPTPARIINLSLGVDDHCTNADQRAIDDAVDAGAIIVAAVGNNGRNTDAQPSSPSHCQNVIGVMAIDKDGYRASYSNFGRDADVAAPGGEAASSTNKILVATNNGATEPSQHSGYRSATGTSVASPHVAGVLALMLSIKPELTNREIQALLLDSSGEFPDTIGNTDQLGMRCERDNCGAGILDALAAVQAVVAHEPGTFLDSPSLAAAESVPVNVGAFSGFGCTVSKRTKHDPMLAALLTIALLMVFVRWLIGVGFIRR